MSDRSPSVPGTLQNGDMAATPHLRPAPGSIPTEPGVYRFKDGADRVIYVGKAKNLRSRLSS